MVHLVRLPLLLLICLYALYGYPQDTTEKQRLSDEKDILQLKSDILNLQNGMDKAKIDAAKAAIGSINTSGLPTGSAQLSNVDIQPTIISYAGLRSVLKKVYADLYGSSCADAVVFKGPALDDIALLGTYQQMLGWATNTVGNYSARPVYGAAAPQFAPAVGFAAIDAAVALGSLFKSDITMTGVSVTADDNAAKYIFAGIVRDRCATDKTVIIDPTDYTYPVGNDSQLQKSLGQLLDKLARVQRIMADVQADDIPRFQQDISDLKAKLKKVDDLTANITKTNALLQGAEPSERKTLTAQLRGYRAELETYNQNQLRSALDTATANLTIARDYVSDATLYSSKVTALITSLTKIDDSGVPFLMRLLRAEVLQIAVQNSPSLTLHILKQGGNNITKKNAFHTGIHYTGGAVVDFELRDFSGARVLKAGEEDAYDSHNEKDSLGSVVR